MQSRLTAIVTILCLAGVAVFVWHLSRTNPEYTVPRPVQNAKPEGKPAVPSVKPSPSVDQPKPSAPPPARKPAAKTPDVGAMAARVEGIVTTVKEAPVKDAEVFAGSDAKKPLARTDDKGRFAIESVSASETILTVHAGHLKGMASISPQPGETIEVRVLIQECGQIEGIVHRGGAPSPGEKVSIEGTDLIATTDAKGYYVFPYVSLGEVSLRVASDTPDLNVEPPDPAVAATIVEEEKTSTVNFDLPVMQSSIEGAVLIEGQPPAEGLINARIVCSYGEYQLKAQVTEDGRYRIEGLPAGTVTMNVIAIDPDGIGRGQNVDIELAESQAVQYDFLFAAGCAISGTVTGAANDERTSVLILKGRAAPSTEIRFEDLVNLSEDVAGNVDVAPDGTFRIDGLDPGPYTALAMAIRAPDTWGPESRPHIRTTWKAADLAPGTEVQLNLAFR